MTRNGPKGPPLFDVLASKRREPSALELALQAAAAERLVDAASAVTEPVSADEGREGSQVGPTTPKREGTQADRKLWAVTVDDEPPLTAKASTSTRSGDTAAGPRIAAFAAATGAAVRPPTLPVEAVLAADGAQAGAQTGIAPAFASPGVTHPATSPDESLTVEKARAGDGALDAGAAAAGQPMEEPRPQRSDSTANVAAAQRLASGAAMPSGTESEASGAVAVAPNDSAPYAEEDDFGPLLVPEEPRRGRRIRRREAAGAASPSLAAASAVTDGASRPITGRRLGTRAGIAVGAGALALLGLAAWRWIPSDSPVAAVGSVQTPAVDVPQTAKRNEAAGDVSMVPWHGIALPVSASAGPRVQGATASGFAHSALGAAIAAANLVVRVDPQAGPSVYEPTLATQVVGDAEGLSHAVREQAGTPTDGATPGALTGWRIDGDPTGSTVMVHLAVDPGADAGLDFAVPLTWVDGDWRIDAPTSGPFFPTGDPSGDYTPFVQEGSSS